MRELVHAVIPTYGQFDFAIDTIKTLKASIPGVSITVLDDNSPGWSAAVQARLKAELDGHELIHYKQRAGVTRAWNAGLTISRNINATYTIVANSDLLFPIGWWEPCKAALEQYQLVGPLTNAAGHRPQQSVYSYITDYQLSDQPADIQATHERFAALYPGRVDPGPVNGYLFVGKTSDFWQYAYSSEQVFNPRYKMTRNEDKYIGQMRAKAGVSAVVCSAFVFHYRSISRGQRRGKSNRGRYARKQSPL